MVRFIVVGRRTWRLTLTVAILLGLGSWAFLGDLTRPPWTGEEIRAAWEGVQAWVAERWPGGPEPAPALPATVPAAAPVTEARPSGAGPGEVGPGEAGSGGVTRSVAEEAVPVTAPGPGGRVEPVSASPLPAGNGYDLFRLDRARVRSERMELLRQVLDDTTASEDRRAEAQLVLLQELNQLEQELAIENLLRLQGYEGAVAILGPDRVEVVLSQVLTAEQASRLGGLVAQVAGVGLQAVTLMDGLSSVQ